MPKTRTLAAAITFVFGGLGGVGGIAGVSERPAYAHADGEDEPGAAPTADAVSSSSKRSKSSRRRKNKVVGHVVPDAQLRTEPLGAPSGHLELYNLNSGEEADLEIFNDDGSYDVEELAEATHILRCKRTDTEKPIDPRLIAILSHIYDHFGKPLQIVSGYRNQRKQTSFHYRGSASDIRIDGVPPKKIVEFANSLDAGGMGIGLYPRAKFVHVDVRPAPSYRWIDNARPNPNSADKRPPRGWKRKKLQS